MRSIKKSGTILMDKLPKWFVYTDYKGERYFFEDYLACCIFIDLNRLYEKKSYRNNNE